MWYTHPFLAVHARVFGGGDAVLGEDDEETEADAAQQAEEHAQHALKVHALARSSRGRGRT